MNTYVIMHMNSYSIVSSDFFFFLFHGNWNCYSFKEQFYAYVIAIESFWFDFYYMIE